MEGERARKTEDGGRRVPPTTGQAGRFTRINNSNTLSGNSLIILMNREQKLELLKNIHWDVNRHGDFYIKIIDGGINTFSEYERMSLLIRLFERLDWQQLVEILGRYHQRISQ